jgi:putative ABC transport system permease protein
MKVQADLTDRVYKGLLSTLVPSFDEADAEEAVATFHELAAEARKGGFLSLFGFWGRESKSLLATAVEEWKRRSEQRREGNRDRASLKGNGRGSMRLDHLNQDLRYAIRRLAGSPGFVLLSVISLSFAIAISTVAFSVVNAAFFRPIPHVADQDQLVRVFTGQQRLSRGPNSFPDFEDYQAMSSTLEELAAVGSREFSVGQVSSGTRQLWGLTVSENFFQFMGIPLARGRGFLPEDVVAGGKVAVIGYNSWQRDFDGAPDVLGRAIHLNGQPYTVVGVGPEGMVGPDDPMLLEVAIPIMDFRDERGRLSLGVYGRMREGGTITQIQAEFDAIARNLVESYPDEWNYRGEDPRGLRILSQKAARVPDGAPLAWILAGVGSLVGLIMLIACSNVANLLLIRAFRRRGEIAVRSAIGAPARRIFNQLMVENLLLFGAAGVLGLLATHWLASLLGSGWSLIPIPGFEFSVDGRVAAFAIALALATGLVFGLIPAMYAIRVDLLSALKGLVPTMRFRFLGIRNLLVGAQVGGSLLMVLVTILLVQSLSHVKTRDLGFDPTGVATLAMDLSHRDYGEEEGRRFIRDLMARTAPIPGVVGVAFASRIPLAGGSTLYGGLEPEGYEAGPQERILAGSAVITAGYLDVTGMTLLRGRDFGDEDRVGSPEVILVNQSFVDRYWPGETGVGKRVTFGSGTVRDVVGVVADVPYRDLVSEVGPHMWLPLGQRYEPDMILHAKTTQDPRSLLGMMRQQVADLDPKLPVVRADLMENISANATQPQRVASAGLGATGFLTLCLAMLGIYGVVGYSVSQRTREMGLRMALGAEPNKVLRMVLREGLILSLIGIVPGSLGALGVGQLISSLLMGMDPLDPGSYALGIGLLVIAVMAASLVPGIRAARAHPMESLRVE